MPLYISHMSFGALSREAKVALAKGATAAGTAACSGEGGILPEEQAAAATYLYEYPPNGYSATDENLRGAAAIEIKIGQGTKPGMGGHLPGEKVTAEIAALRGKPVGEDVHSPSRFPGIETPGDLRALVSRLRDRSQGRPIGVKIAAGHLEEDLAFIAQSGADFITIDGRGGATGASPRFLRDSTSLPTIYALHRARRFLDSHRLEMELVITGGLRTGPDFAKALAMGADAVAIASSALMALGCRQYRICGSGRCPMGIATQDPVLRKRLDGEEGARRVERFLRGSCEAVSYTHLDVYKRQLFSQAVNCGGQLGEGGDDRRPRGPQRRGALMAALHKNAVAAQGAGHLQVVKGVPHSHQLVGRKTALGQPALRQAALAVGQVMLHPEDGRKAGGDGEGSHLVGQTPPPGGGDQHLAEPSLP